jgi:hypothetical protein
MNDQNDEWMLELCTQEEIALSLASKTYERTVMDKVRVRVVIILTIEQYRISGKVEGQQKGGRTAYLCLYDI